MQRKGKPNAAGPLPSVPGGGGGGGERSTAAPAPAAVQQAGRREVENGPARSTGGRGRVRLYRLGSFSYRITPGRQSLNCELS